MRESNKDKRVLLRAGIGLRRRLDEEGRLLGEGEGRGVELAQRLESLI